MLTKDFANIVAAGIPMSDVIAAIADVDCSVMTFSTKWPRLLKYYPQSKGSPAQWADFAIRHPDKRMFIDFGRFRAKDWTTLLTADPRFIDHALPYIHLLEAGNLKCILLRNPGLIHNAAILQAVTDTMLQMPVDFNARAIHPYPLITKLESPKIRGARNGGLYGRMTGSKLDNHQKAPIIPVVVKRRRAMEMPEETMA